MRKAIDLARRGQFAVAPNPMVGAVLLRDDHILAEGWHQKFGGPHAEIMCLENARKNGIDTKNATLVVTLEPCCHYGKTPPCTEAILSAGVTRLVYGCHDPNNMAKGGAQILADKGLEVIGPIEEQACKDLIADFTIWQTTKRPYIILKLASTIDGRIATRTGHSKWISNEASRKKVHKLRGGIGKAGGAILIGGGTFRSDNPRLSARLDTGEKQPFAAILTSRLPRVDSDFSILKERPEQTIFFASPAATASISAENLRELGCKVLAIGPMQNGEPDFCSMFEILRQDFNCLYVLCEGGGKLALSLLETGYMDEFHLFMSPIILGDNEARPLFDGRSPLSLEDAVNMRVCQAAPEDGDIFMILRPR